MHNSACFGAEQQMKKGHLLQSMWRNRSKQQHIVSQLANQSSIHRLYPNWTRGLSDVHNANIMKP
jgi:hypothetical protein